MSFSVGHFTFLAFRFGFKGDFRKIGGYGRRGKPGSHLWVGICHAMLCAQALRFRHFGDAGLCSKSFSSTGSLDIWLKRKSPHVQFIFGNGSEKVSFSSSFKLKPLVLPPNESLCWVKKLLAP